MASRVPAGRLASLRSRSTYSWSPASGQRSGWPATRAMVRAFIEGELAIRIRRAVGRAGAAAHAPVVADQPDGQVELALLQHLALVDGRPAHDQLQRSVVSRRLADVVEAGARASVVRWAAIEPICADRAAGRPLVCSSSGPAADEVGQPGPARRLRPPGPASLGPVGRPVQGVHASDAEPAQRLRLPARGWCGRPTGGRSRSVSRPRMRSASVRPARWEVVTPSPM